MSASLMGCLRRLSHSCLHRSPPRQPISSNSRQVSLRLHVAGDWRAHSPCQRWHRLQHWPYASARISSMASSISAHRASRASRMATSLRRLACVWVRMSVFHLHSIAARCFKKASGPSPCASWRYDQGSTPSLGMARPPALCACPLAPGAARRWRMEARPPPLPRRRTQGRTRSERPASAPGPPCAFHRSTFG